AERKREPVRVTDTNGFDGLPVFSPNGSQLCWTSSRTSDGKSQLFMADWNNERALAALSAAPWQTDKNAKALDNTASLVPAIREEDLRQEVGYLASDELEGRMSGSAGST